MSLAIGIWVVRDEAEELGHFLEKQLGGKLGGLICGAGKSNREAFAASLAEHSQWVLVMAAGIAVRYLEGLTRHKSIDPGVVVLDVGQGSAADRLAAYFGLELRTKRKGR